jgi:lysophospholipase L1-like esterase
MKRLALACLLAAFGATALAASTTTPDDGNYRARPNYQTYFNDYLTLKKGHPVDLIFIGDSITEHWRWGTGYPVWKQHFEERAFDFGQGGDKTQHVLWRLDNFDLSGFAPRVAVIMIGTNNFNDKPEDIVTGVKGVIASTQKKFPGVKVILTSILPNARANEKMAQVNPHLAALADRKTIYFLDLASKFPAEGDNWKGLGRDKLHLTTEGYKVWAAELEALLPTVLRDGGKS